MRNLITLVFIIISILTSILLTKSYYSYNKTEYNETKKQLLYSTVDFSSLSYQKKLINFMLNNDFKEISLKQLDSLKKKSDLEVNSKIEKIVIKE